MVDSVWTEGERRAWQPPERLTPSEWAERYRCLPRRDNPEPGPLRLSRTPYMREILDALGPDSQYEFVVLMKVPQSGGSTAAQSIVGFWADREADPILILYPDERSATEQVVKRITPMFRESDRLRSLLTGRAWDAKRHLLDLEHCTIYGAWAGSPQAMSSRAIRFLVLEETDKYLGAARESRPEDLIRHRTTTFRSRRRVFALSTPTTKMGTISRLFRASRDRRHYHSLCPHCEELVLWKLPALRWDRKAECESNAGEEVLLEVADALEVGDLEAWVDCSSCGSAISERERCDAVTRGEWVSDGFPPGERPTARRVAYHVSGFVSPWVSFADLASAYLRAVHGGDLHDFYNGSLGMPAEEVHGSLDPSAFESRATARPYTIPPWATCVVAGADTQARDKKPYWVWTARAWGRGNRSRLVGWGRAYSTEELARCTLGARWVVEGTRTFQGATLLMVDSGGGAELDDSYDGNTTHLVYEMARRDPARVIPIKGASRPQDRPIRSANVAYLSPGESRKAMILLHTLDIERFKDMLAALVDATDPVLWEENQLVTPEYVAQMTAQEKTRTKLGRKYVTKWLRTSRARDDLFDASVYCLAGAHMLRADDRARKAEARRREAPPPTSTDEELSERQRRRIRRSEVEERSRITKHRKRSWIGRRR